MQLGPVAIGAGAALAVVGGTIYAFTELRNKIKDARDASAEAYGELRRSQQLANDELDVSIAKLENEIRVLEHKPVNRAAEALSELRVEADKASDSLQSTLVKLNEILSKNGIGAFKGFFTFQESTTKIADLQKNFQREVREIEKARKEALDSATGTKDADAINKRFDEKLSGKRTYYESAADTAVTVAKTKGTDTSGIAEAAEGFTSSLEAEAGKTAKRRQELADQQKKQALEDAKKGVADARALAVARLEAQIKALDDGAAIAKKNSDAEISLAHGTVQVQIAALEDRRDAAIATAEEELRVAKEQQAAITADQAANSKKRIALIRAEGAAESQGKTGTEAATIGVKTSEKIESLQAKEQEEWLSAQIKVDEAETRIEVERAKVAREDAADVEKDLLSTLEEIKTQEDARRKVELEIKEIQEKGSGQEAEIAAAGEKLQLEREYGLAAVHNDQQQIDYLKQIAAIEERARAAKIAGVRADLNTAQSAAGNTNLPESTRNSQRLKAAELQVQLDDLIAQSANKRYEADTKVFEKQLELNDALQAQIVILDALTKWKQIDFGTVEKEFARVIVALPQQLGKSLAASIFNAPKQGQSKGAEIGKGLVETTKKAGQDIAGKLIEQAIEKLIVQLVGQAALQALQSSVTAANTAATTGLAVTMAATTATQVPAMVAMTEAIAALVPALYADAGSHLIPGFATGGPVPHDMIAQVHGGEYVLNKDQVSGRDPLPPEFMQAGGIVGLSGALAPARLSLAGLPTARTTNNNSATALHFNVYEARNAKETARQIARLVGNQSGQFSPASR
jgi:predicted Fe-Mo cluster-binding NifX family protein